MEARAQAKYIRMSPFKVRRVVNLICGKPVNEAVAVLSFLPHRSAPVVKKVLESAVANAINKAGELNLSTSDLYVKAAYVDEGPTLKRIRPMAMGRAGLIRKRMSHITVIVASK